MWGLKKYIICSLESCLLFILANISTKNPWYGRKSTHSAYIENWILLNAGATSLMAFDDISGSEHG